MGVKRRTVVDATCDKCTRVINTDVELFVDYGYAGVAFCLHCMAHMGALEFIQLALDGDNIYLAHPDGDSVEFKHDWQRVIRVVRDIVHATPEPVTTKDTTQFEVLEGA